jgi:hypothetical protein
MTDQKPPTEQQLDEYAQLANAAYVGPWRNDQTQDDTAVVYAPATTEKGSEYAHVLFGADWGTDADAAFIAAARTAVPALVAEVRRLRAELATALRPNTPRLCACGHSNLAHTVPAPHSCFAHGQTCPCQGYRQLPHDEAVAQLARNRQAAAERAVVEEAHVVADDSDDPEHVDDCPGCEAFTLTGHRAAPPQPTP